MPEPSLQHPTQLTFDWRRPPAQWPRLLLWLLVMAAALFAFFALFRIVYPQSERLIPTAQQIILLDGTDPATRGILNSLQDRDFMVLPENDSRRSPVALDEKAPVFHPTLENHELKLQDLPQRDISPAPVRLMDVTTPVLPGLDLSELKKVPPPAAVPRHKFGLKVDGELAGRKIVSAPDFSKLKLADAETWRIHLGVDAQGRVIFALPLESVGKLEEAAPLFQLMRRIRFAPVARTPEATAGGGAPMWGTVSLEWQP